MSPASLAIVSDQAEWTRLYARLRAPSVLASYRYMTAGARLIDGGVAEAAALDLGGDILFHPYIKRPAPFDRGYFDLISVYDFGGFWFSTDDPVRRQALMTRFEQEFGCHAADNRIICEFIRCHPMAEIGSLSFQHYVLRKHQENIIIRTTNTIADVRAAYTNSRRLQVRQGNRNGLSLEFVDDPRTFMQAYYASLDRYGADRDYYFPGSFIEEIKGNLLIAHVRSPDGDLCAAYLFLVDGKGIYLFLAASVPDKLPLRPNDFGYDAIVKHAIELGLDHFHLGGGATTLYQYKRSFSPLTIPFHHAYRIYLDEPYNDLVCLHDAAFPIGRDSKFFPRYRAGLRSRRENHFSADYPPTR